jgi:hypothetical protein
MTVQTTRAMPERGADRQLTRAVDLTSVSPAMFRDGDHQR